ncbi:rRNA biogenesis protein rrp36 [Podila epicladia]|nr:rRNA biogenesis protein rrp36 [Podila epicladia]KAG0100669.1 rRNA biogenesis protein rrp36 [Podila epicladia]
MAIKPRAQAEDAAERAMKRMQAFDQSDSDMDHGNSGESGQEESEEEEEDSDDLEDREQDQSEDEEEEEEEEDEDSDEDSDDSDEDSDSDSDSDDSDNSDADDKKLKELQKNLSQIPFDKLAEIQQKLGMKVFHQTLRGTEKKKAATKGLQRKQVNNYMDDEEESEEEDDSEEEEQKPKGKMDRLREAMNKDKKQRKVVERRNDKNKPMEIGSKKPVGRFRQVVEVASTRRRDPRFDSLSGKLDTDLFEKSYGFLKDYQADEMKKLRELIKKERDEDMKEKLQTQLSRMVDRQATEAAQKRRQEIKREHKRKEKELISKGKNPFFLKKADQKKLELIDKFKQLKDSPKALAKAMEKRRKRNSAKEKKTILGGAKRRRID